MKVSTPRDYGMTIAKKKTKVKKKIEYVYDQNIPKTYLVRAPLRAEINLAGYHWAGVASYSGEKNNVGFGFGNPYHRASPLPSLSISTKSRGGMDG